MSHTSPCGYLNLVLHAHLPFVRHPEHPVFLEENWLFEAMLECYLPLLDMMDRLTEEQVPFRLTMSLAPPLCEMLTDPLLQERFAAHLNKLIELSEKELIRTRSQPEFFRSAEMYQQRFQRTRQLYETTYARDLIGAFRRLRDAGSLEIIACAGTHALLPLMANPRSRRAHIRVGQANHQKHFGREPKGMWLPECAYTPGIDLELAAAGIDYFFLDSHGILFARPRPQFGTFTPVRCPGGPAVFGRDIVTSKQVWSAETGYPGDPNYREFYRDLGYDGEMQIVQPYLHPDGIRHDLGIKYHRVTGGVGLADKEPYDPAAAYAQVLKHAENFLAHRRRQMIQVGELIGRPPVITAPYDAELFGHWWYEGPQFIEAVLRLAATQDDVALTTPPMTLAMLGDLQEVQPSASSWGDKGYFEVWLNGANDWVYPRFHAAEDRFAALVDAHPAATLLTARVLNQACRELMLAQSSDWGFILTTGTVTPYAKKRIKEHLARFDMLCAMLEVGTAAIDEKTLQEIEQQDSVFAEMDYRVFAE